MHNNNRDVRWYLRHGNHMIEWVFIVLKVQYQIEISNETQTFTVIRHFGFWINEERIGLKMLTIFAF